MSTRGAPSPEEQGRTTRRRAALAPQQSWPDLRYIAFPQGGGESVLELDSQDREALDLAGWRSPAREPSPSPAASRLAEEVQPAQRAPPEVHGPVQQHLGSPVAQRTLVGLRGSPEIFVAEAYAKAREFRGSMHRLGYQTHVQVFLDDAVCIVLPRDGDARCSESTGPPAALRGSGSQAPPNRG